jgi:hypothetical protein
MEILSFIALILLSLVGYSAGAVIIAGNASSLKSHLLDLGFIVLIWGGAIYSRIFTDLNKWILVLCWLILGIGLGMLSVFLLKHFKKLDIEEKKEDEFQVKGNLWKKWKNFSLRMGSFQSRIVLSLFFLVFVFPFALITKIFINPLRLNEKKFTSYWDSKKEISRNIDDFRRQF